MNDLTGLDLIAAERGRQIVEEGWSSKHDDAHNNDELAAAEIDRLLRRSEDDP